MRYIVLIAAILFFTGCSQEVPPVKKYLLNVKIPTVSNDTTCKTKSLKLLTPYAPYEYTTNNLYYVYNFQEGSYTQSSWANSVVSEIYATLLKTLRRGSLFYTVDNYTSISKGDLNLEIDINDFRQYFNEDKTKSYVVVDITLTLIDRKKYSVIAQKNFYKKLETISADAKGGVEALSKAFETTLSDMISWIEGECQ